MFIPDLLLLAHIFSQPLEIPTRAISLLWALPICLTIALVYKALKLETFRFSTFLREVVLLFLTIIGFLVLVAIVLVIIAYLVRL